MPIVDTAAKEERIGILLNYFDPKHKNNHDFYFFRFVLCEILNFFNVIFQIYFVDFFLGGEFTTYGTDVMAITEMSNGMRTDPMSRVFPKVNILLSCM